MNKLFMNNQAGFVRTRLAQAQSDILQSEVQDVPSIISDSISIIRHSLENLAAPLFAGRELNSIEQPDSDQYNDDMLDIQHDLALCFNGVTALRTNMDMEFNSTATAFDMLDAQVAEALKEVRDVTIRNDIEGMEDVVIAGDDFSGSDWIDSNYPVDGDPCFLDVTQGAITLPLISETKSVSASAKVSVMYTNKNMTGPEGINPTDFFFEGQFYGMDGRAMPAGGAWNIAVIPINQGEGQTEIASTAKDNPNFAERVLNGTVIADGMEFPEGPKFTAKYIGPDQNTLASFRNTILDGNPDTFWQCEWVFAPGQEPLGDKVPDTTIKRNQSDFFEVGLLVDLGEHLDASKIVLDPLVFHPTERIEVVSIATASTRDEIPKAMDYQGAGVGSIQLTDAPDRPVEEGQLAGIVSPDAEGADWGLAWSFTPRRIRYIMIKIRQRSAYITPYQTMFVKMTRTARAVSAIEEQ